MVEIINATEIRTARKAHVCNWCGCTIPVGEKYMTGVFKYDGMIYSWKNHKRCDELVAKLNMEGDEGVTGEDFYEYITEEFRKIWQKIDPDIMDNKDFKIPSFKEQVEFVYEQRCQKSSVKGVR